MRNQLTQREKEVLQLIKQGLTNKEIANKLMVTHHTIKAHISSILYKLECKNRTEVAAYSVTHLPDLVQP